jgi:hypothetical protein
VNDFPSLVRYSGSGFVAAWGPTSLSTDLDAKSSASSLVVGLYTDAGSQPGSLLADGSTSSPVAGAWNSITAGSVSLVAGKTYWITVLGVGGSMVFRDSKAASCSSVTSALSDLSSLPAAWSSGTTWPTCSISANVTGIPATPTPTLDVPTNTAPPTIAGTAAPGSSLTTSNGSWTNAPDTFGYQWQDCDASGSNCADIPGATTASYTPTSADVGHTLVSVVTATNAGGSNSQASSPTAPVAPQTDQQASSIWPASTVPGTVTEDDPNAVEPGLKFQSAVATTVTGVRFYKKSSNTGTHSESLLVAPRSSPDPFAGSSLSPAWTVISRHGEYAQDETECNVPQGVTVASDTLDIGTEARPTSCAISTWTGSVRHAPSVWPHAAGDVQWTSFSFTYGNVSYRAKFPPGSTGTWPAIWLLGSNCQATNIATADVGCSTCPDLGTPAYAEIDMTECDTWNWCQLALAQPNGFPVCGYQVDNSWHTFVLAWTRTGISMAVDGKPKGCSYTQAAGYVIPSTPMFLIIQTQTGGTGGTPSDGALPAHLDVSNVTVTQP